jgi:simple sugar transport system permease protein
MSTASLSRGGFRVPSKYVPVIASFALFVLMFVIGAMRYPAFGSAQVILNIFVDNSFLLVVAVGMTFVILTGGIDLSVGAVVALGTVLCGTLIQKQGWSPFLVIPLVLAIGSLLGLAMGAMIHYFEIQPFIVTLAGLFLARGTCYAITTDSVTIDQPDFVRMASSTLRIGEYFLTSGAIIAIVVALIGFFVLHYTRLGRNVYAIGGSKQSALLMGLPVARTTLLVYTISGFCAALGGVLLSFYTLSGFGSLAIGMELDAIAAVVIGGTLLVGGSGYLAGTVVGVLVLGLIQTLISFDGTLSSWWTKIFIATLLLAFILLQRLVFARGKMGGLSRGGAT